MIRFWHNELEVFVSLLKLYLINIYVVFLLRLSQGSLALQASDWTFSSNENTNNPLNNKSQILKSDKIQNIVRLQRKFVKTIAKFIGFLSLYSRKKRTKSLFIYLYI